MSNEPASFPSGDDPAQNPPTTTYLRYQIPGYTTYDASIGVSKDAWTLQLAACYATALALGLQDHLTVAAAAAVLSVNLTPIVPLS